MDDGDAGRRAPAGAAISAARCVAETAAVDFADADVALSRMKLPTHGPSIHGSHRVRLSLERKLDHSLLDRSGTTCCTTVASVPHMCFGA
jgi:hypothetical protein